MEAGLSALPAGPVVAAPPEWLEEAIGEGTAGGAVEVLKILAKSDPRSNTATFISRPWQFCPRCCLNLKTTGNPASELHPPPTAGIATRRPGAGRRSWGPGVPGGLWCSPHAEGRVQALSPSSTWDSPSRRPNDLQIAEAAGSVGGGDHALRGAIPSLPWCCEALKSQRSGTPRRGRAAAASASATAG